MLAEFLEKITQLADQGREVGLVSVAGDDRRVWIDRAGEDLHEVTIPPLPRSPRLCGLADVVAACKDPYTIAKEPELYFDEQGIVLLLDRKDRHDRAEMFFSQSSRFNELLGLENERCSLPVGDAIKRLRFDLHGIGADAVIAALRRVDFTRTSAGSRVTEHGKESLGKSVEAQAQAVGDVPEVVELTVPLYTNQGLAGFTAKVRVGIYLDVHAEAVEFGVLADECARAREQVMSQVRQHFRDTLPAVPAFYGRP